MWGQTMAPEPFCTLRPNTRNGPALVLLSGVLFSGGGILYRSTSLNREKPVAAEWRYLCYRFIALTSAALTQTGACLISDSGSENGPQIARDF